MILIIILSILVLKKNVYSKSVLKKNVYSKSVLKKKKINSKKI